METWGNDKVDGGREGPRIGSRETAVQRSADDALDRAYRLLDWMDCAASCENPDLGLQWLPGFLRRGAESKYEVVAKDRNEQIDLVCAMARRNPLHGVLYLTLASAQPLSSKELSDLLTITLTAERYSQALLELEVNGLIKVRGGGCRGADLRHDFTASQAGINIPTE